MKLMYHNSINFGDYISKIICEKISGSKVEHVDEKYNKSEHYVAVGSLLTKVNENSIVWGAGMAWNRDKIQKAKKYCAVRGKLSLQKVHKAGYDCDSYGDPVLLIPDLFNVENNNSNQYELGIIPHMADYKIAKEFYGGKSNILVIDITKNWELFISDILSCHKLVSSSLHGIIISHSYRKDCGWCEFSNNVIGDGFKFLDYFSSVGQTPYVPINLREKINDNVLMKSIPELYMDFDKKQLLNSCPFLEGE